MARIAWTLLGLVLLICNNSAKAVENNLLIGMGNAMVGYNFSAFAEVSLNSSGRSIKFYKTLPLKVNLLGSSDFNAQFVEIFFKPHHIHPRSFFTFFGTASKRNGATNDVDYKIVGGGVQIKTRLAADKNSATNTYIRFTLSYFEELDIETRLREKFIWPGISVVLGFL